MKSLFHFANMDAKSGICSYRMGNAAFFMHTGTQMKDVSRVDGCHARLHGLIYGNEMLAQIFENF